MPRRASIRAWSTRCCPISARSSATPAARATCSDGNARRPWIRRGAPSPRRFTRSPREIVFTSGATESNNLAIRGLAERRRLKGHHIVSVQTEHKAVLDPLARLSRRDFRVTQTHRRARRMPPRRSPRCQSAGRGHHRRHVSGDGDAGQQRNRRDPAAGGNRRPVSSARRGAAHRCHAGRRTYACGCAGTAGRSAEFLGA